MHSPTWEPSDWGIETGYHDVRGGWHDAPSATVRGLLAALGAEPIHVDGEVRATRPAPAVGQDVWIVGPGERPDAGGPYRVVTEDGGEVRGNGVVLHDLPPGYHDLHLEHAERTVRLVVSPRRCPDPPTVWGWAVQLYAARSSRSWGMGDLDDLATIARWARNDGAGALLVNPLHGAHPGPAQEASPYFPASRVFRNPLYLSVPAVQGADEVDDLAAADAAGRALLDAGTIDRDAVWAAKRPVLEAAHRASRGVDDPSFARFRDEQGAALDAWAAWCVAVDMAGPDRSRWPVALDPATLVAATQADPELRARAHFHAWLQWQLDEQLGRAAQVGPGLVADVAIGCDAGGFDTWLWPDAFIDAVRVGAPPDEFAPDGQDWGLPPFDPWALRRLSFEPFIRTLRAGLRHAQGLRMDHVMGLFRLFTVPVGGTPADGCYLRYPASELLDILALEAHRAGAYVVGEDLGTVQTEVRDELARRQVLGTKLVWFEDEPPVAWDRGALGAVTTHDLPTVTGAWTGEDVEDQRSAGATVVDGAVEGLADALAQAADIDRDEPAGRAVAAAHRLLAASPCAVTLATLEDAAGQARRPNLPGTVREQRPNWSVPLPCRLEDLPWQPGTRAIVAAFASRPDPSP